MLLDKLIYEAESEADKQSSDEYGDEQEGYESYGSQHSEGDNESRAFNVYLERQPLELERITEEKE